MNKELAQTSQKVQAFAQISSAAMTRMLEARKVNKKSLLDRLDKPSTADPTASHALQLLVDLSNVYAEGLSQDLDPGVAVRVTNSEANRELPSGLIALEARVSDSADAHEKLQTEYEIQFIRLSKVMEPQATEDRTYSNGHPGEGRQDQEDSAFH
ncbi:hypothetical protein BDN72DRAFT_81854 [Pluteus cervinus]|uniref:Uncharacterized protein n=1 Tax=Pluteus cervinus TaxID=181527 RepID=A0ACD3B8K0_9AGAR|nr:hypothetical protein BDN72DRAFT_81854 [Pluteus cervinus]